MTRKHFQAFAEFAAHADLTDDQVGQLIILLSGHNERFDKMIFWEAVAKHRNSVERQKADVVYG